MGNTGIPPRDRRDAHATRIGYAVEDSGKVQAPARLQSRYAEADGAGLKPARAIGGSLNALARATALYRKGVEKKFVADGQTSETQKQVAERCARAWRKARPNALEFLPTELRVAGSMAVEGDDNSAWILYAYMAGVRRIEPRRTMTTNDLMRLVQMLIALEPTVESIEKFREWIDADGAEGFDVRVHTSFREVMEEIDMEDQEFAHAFKLARFEVPNAADAVYVDSSDLDRVAMRKEFELPIELYAHEAATAVGGLSDEVLRGVGARCDDANAWAMAELEAVLAVPALRSAVSPESMAKRIVSRLSDEADERFLMLLTRLKEQNDPFKRAVAQALATDEVGEIISQQVELETERAVEALGKFLILSPVPLARVVIGGLLDRASENPLALEGLRLLGQWYGAPQLCDWTVPTALEPDTAACMGEVLGQCGAGAAEVGRMAMGTALPNALALLDKLPAPLLLRLGRPLNLLWTRANGEQLEQLAEIMIRSRSVESLKHLGELLVAGKVDTWKGRRLYALCAALVEQGLGREFVLAIATDRKAEEGVRLICIDCLKSDPSLVEEVLRFRMSRLFESSEVKERIRKLAGEARR